MKKILLVALMALCSASFANDHIKIKTGGGINLINCRNCEEDCLDETRSLCDGSKRCYEEVQKMRKKCKEDCENRCNSN